jgi:PAS domain S-box-containing protein
MMPALSRCSRSATVIMGHSSRDISGRQFLLWLLALLLFLPAVGTSAALTGNERVLVLNSYHHGYTWSDNETAGIVATLSAAGITLDPNIEYLDTKRLSKQEHFPLLQQLLQVKLTNKRPDVIISLDDPAFEFAITYRQQLFVGIPIVFIGKNDYSPAMLRGERGITGVVEHQDFRGTVDAALQLQPETREVVVVHDYTPSGLFTRRQVAEQLAPLADRVTVRYLPQMTIDEVLTALRALRSGSVVLAVSFGRDKAGRVFNHEDLAKTLSDNVSVPVYSTKVERLGHGVVGGSLMDGRTHGTQGAELALRILRGEAADAIPTLEQPRSELMFDHRQLVRFKIPLERLPAGSRVVNRPESFYAKHRLVINVALAIITMLVMSLVAVITANRRRKAAEREIYEVQGYRELFESASDPLFIVDGNGCIIEASRAAQELLQRGAVSLVQRAFAELVTDPQVAGLQAHFTAVRAHGQGVINTSFLLPQADTIPVEISSRAIRYRGQPALLCAARDMSVRVTYEKKLKGLNAELEERIRERTLELEVANRELESFCYSVSHDLQAPLRHINSFCLILTEDHGRDLDENATACLKRICRAAFRMGQLIDDLLNLSRISRFEMCQVTVDVSALAREILEDLDHAHPERQVAWQVASDLEATADRHLLRIALANLLENAWKYTGNAAEPRIEFGEGLTADGRRAFFVRDNGAGFDMQFADKLFVPFQRLHHEHEFPGTGIGLATVARVINRHGGQIWADAAEGHGATFWFTLAGGPPSRS